MTAVESKLEGQGQVQGLYRWKAARIDLNSTDSRVQMDVRGISTIGVQLAVDAGSSASGVVIQIRGRMLFEDQLSEDGGDDREGLPYVEIDSGVRLESEGCTTRNIDVTRYAQVEAIVNVAASGASEGTLVIYGE